MLKRSHTIHFPKMTDEEVYQVLTLAANQQGGSSSGGSSEEWPDLVVVVSGAYTIPMGYVGRVHVFSSWANVNPYFYVNSNQFGMSWSFRQSGHLNVTLCDFQEGAVIQSVGQLVVELRLV